MSKEMSYTEYMELVHNGITTQAGNSGDLEDTKAQIIKILG